MITNDRVLQRNETESCMICDRSRSLARDTSEGQETPGHQDLYPNLKPLITHEISLFVKGN